MIVFYWVTRTRLEIVFDDDPGYVFAFKIGFDHADRIVRRPCVHDAVTIYQVDDRLETLHNDVCLVFHNHVQAYAFLFSF